MNTPAARGAGDEDTGHLRSIRTRQRFGSPVQTREGGQRVERRGDQGASRLGGARGASGSAASAPSARPPSSSSVSDRASESGSSAPGLRGQVAHPGEHGLLVRDGALVHGRAGHGLGGGVDERAAPVAVAPAGRAEGVEEPDQLVRGIGSGGLGGGVQLPGPDSVDLVEVGEDELVLGREVLVEGRLGHAGLGDDQVHADRPDAPGVEEPEGGRRGCGRAREVGVTP